MHIYIYIYIYIFNVKCPFSTYDNIFLPSRGRNHALKKLRVRMGCTVPSPLTWPATKKSDGAENFATTGSVDGCRFLPETKCVVTRPRLGNTRVLYGRDFLPLMGAEGERPEFHIKPPLGAPLMTFPRSYLLKSFSQGNTSARHLGFEISFPSPR